MSALFDALVDDAGLFPPTSLPMTEALERHERDRRQGSPVLTHRFLCPSSRIDSLRRQEIRPDRIGLIVDTDTIPNFRDLPVDFIEVRGTPVATRARLFVEVPVGGKIPEMPPGVGLKVRCGGLEAAAFPRPAELGAFIQHCADQGIPFKATAGLHHAVRHFDPSIGVDRHGFLNLVLATCAAVSGDDPVTVLKLLDVGELVRLAHAVPDGIAQKARNLFVSYGSCSTSTPLEDLQALGLIEKATV